MIRKSVFLVFVIGLLFGSMGSLSSVAAQKTSPPYGTKSRSAIVRNTEMLEKAMVKGDPGEIADAYYRLGDEYEKAGQPENSEKNFLKARDYYNRIRDDDKLADVYRRLARVQEKLNKNNDAAANYTSAARSGDSKRDAALNTVNMEDAERVKAKSASPAVLEQKAMRKLEAAKSADDDNSDIISESYQQVADAQMSQSKLPPAITNYKEAMSNAADPEAMLEINSKLSEALVRSNAIDSAITVTSDLANNPAIATDPRMKIKAINQLSTLYMAKKEDKTALALLENTYELAINSGQTYEARNAAVKLAELYARHGDLAKSVAAYQRFASDLQQVIRADSSLMDQDVIRLSAEKIKKLETEQLLKDRLIRRQHLINYLLLAGLLLLGATVFYIIRSLRSIRHKNKVIALHSLRKEMNPHFIFNSLNSINQFIAKNDERSANKYLTSFATLMREVLDNSGSDFISLSVETSLLQRYLELEHRRFADKFDYSFQCEINDIGTDILVPNMIIQPYVENAVWHGLRYRKTKGTLDVTFACRDGQIVVVISENGIGRKASEEMKTDHQKQRKSRGSGNIDERIRLLNDLYGLDIRSRVSDHESGEGTLVVVTFPDDIASKTRKNQIIEYEGSTG